MYKIRNLNKCLRFLKYVGSNCITIKLRVKERVNFSFYANIRLRSDTSLFEHSRHK